MHKAIRIVAILLVVAALLLAVTALMLGRRQPTMDVPPLVEAALPGVNAGHRQVVAVQELPAGMPIARDAVAETAMPQPVAGGFSTLEQVIGTVPLRTIAAGAALERSSFAHGIASLLAPGERAIAIPVDELAGAGNRIAPGDHVDVFLSLRGSSSGDTGAAQTRLLLSRLRVLGYGGTDLQHAQAPTLAAQPPADDRRAQAIAGTGNEPAANERTAQANARSALLAVPVAQANALLLGAQSGKLFLALRHPGDTGVADASLFPQPRPVLAPRRDLDDAQRAQAGTSADNTAFSGIDLDALSGQTQPADTAPRTTPAPIRVGAPARERGIEIIRGDGRGAAASGF